jgi:polysaccharide biosynthesis transport protein
MLNQTNLPFDPRELVSVLKRRQWLLIVPCVVVTLAGLATSMILAPQYESSVVISVARPIKLSDSMERMLGEFREVVGAPDANTADLRSFLHDITSSPFVARVAELAEFPEDAEFQKEATGLSGRHPELSAQEVKVEVLAERLRASVKLEYITRDHLKLSVRAGAPYQARKLASTMGVVFVEEMEKQSQQAVFRSLNFSYEQLARYEKLLQEKIDQRSRLDTQIKALESNTTTAVGDVKSTLSAEIQRRQLELRDLNTQERTLESNLQRRAASDIRIRESARIGQERALLDSLVESVERLLMQSAANSAAMADLQMRIATSEDVIAREFEHLVRAEYPSLDQETVDQQADLLSVRLRISYLERFVKSLESGLAVLTSRLQDLPDLRSKMEALTQEIAAAQRLRDRLKDQQESFEISQALVQESSYKVVEDARLELTPVWPNRLLIFAIALLAGLGLGIGAVLVAEMSDATLSTTQAVESAIGLPVAGIVPRLDALRDFRKPR